ncbi:MAG: LamG-like jellyroll fold domain-containing protein [Cyclobacteriaceae bacterium]
MRSNAGFNDGNWHHVAIVYRGANNGVIYIDGVDETSSNALGVPAFSASPLVIGSRSGTAFSLEGSIDEVRIWDDERTIGEIQTNQFAAVTGNEQGLVAYYRFDETSGTVLPDLTGNGLDGTLTNMAGTEWTASGAMAPILNEATNVTVNGFTMNWEAIANATGLTFDLDDDSDFSTPILTDVAVSSPTGSTEIVSQDLSAYKNQELHLRIRFAKGAFQSVYSETVSFYVEPNYAFDFDGSNDYVNIPDADELSFGNGSTDSPFSVEAWAKFDNVTSKSIVSKRTGSNEWHMTLSGGGRLSVALVDNSSSGFLFGENNTFTFVTDQWYHLAFSYDGSATAAGIRLYVDGVEIPNSPSSSGTYTAMENTSSPVQIGAINTSTNLMDGQIDEVRIWNVARTESDLIANMNNELTGNEANLVAYYNFSDAGTLLTDLAGLNNGTVNGATRTFPALNIDTAPEINLYDLTITPASTEITVDIKLDGSANLYYVVTQSATAPSAAQILIGHDDENNQAYNYGNYNGVSSAGNFEIGGDNGANDSPFDPEANYHIYWVAYNSPSDYSEVIASAFTTEALPPEVTLTTVPLADANLFQSSSDNLVYKFTMAVTGGSVSTQGFFFGLGGSFSSADFTASGFTLLQNTIDDFGSASVVGSSSYEPGAPVPANSTGWLFDNTYNDGDLIYFYVSADIDAMAGVGNTFNISQPGLNPNFGINEPKTMIDGGLAIGQTFTIITADAIPPTLVSLSPADEAFDVPTTSSTFQLTFDEDMKKGTGNIEFRLASNNTLITTLDVLDPQVSISGAVVTLGVNGLVDCSEGVSVIIPSSALTDLGENTFSGLTSGDWDFYGPTSPVIDFSADMVVDNTNCGGIPSGSLDANDAIFKDGIPAPSSSFDFQWFLNSPGGTPAGSTSSITNLSAGNYYLVVTESSTGCTSDPELFVVMDDFTDVPVLSVSNQPDRFCVNGNGEITVMASSSNEPSDYTFKLYNGIGTATTPIVNEVSIGSTGIIKTDLEEGTYTIEVINNATLCSTIQQTTILENTQLPSINSANVSVSDVTDCGGTDGAIDVSLGVEEDGSSQSAANYSFEWFTGSGTSGAAAGSGAILSAVGQGTYTVKFTNNITGCFSASEFSIGLNDQTDPVAIAQDLTVSLDPSGTATITANDIDNGSFDNCGIADISIDQSSFTCINVGPNPVTLTVTDTNGNQSTAIATVTIVDDSAPTAIAQDLTVSLDPSGTAIITANDIDNGSFDNCGVADISLAQSSFTCAHVGPNPVTLTVTDTNGNQSTAIATVTIVDDSAPTAIAQDLTVSLDPSGTATITANDIDNGSFDNCGVADISIDQSSFTCTHAGPNSVVLTVTDINGNVSQSIATVTVLEDVLPVAVVQDITIGLDENGSAIITPSELDNGSNDNCGIPDLFLDKTAFTCADLGNNIVNFTARDRSGNESSTTAIVTVVDDLPPSVLTQNITEELDATGSAAITAEQIDNGSFDNCMIQNIAVDISSFTCTDVGANLVTFTATDGSGNQTSATATVTVVDAIPPTVLTQNITVELDEAGSVSIAATDLNAGSFDNCEIASFSVDQSSFTCSDLGSNLVNLTVTDVNGNANTAVAYVLVEDNTPPIPLGQDIIVSLDEFGNANINQTEVNNGSNDNCGVSTVVLSNSNFTCADVGANTVEMLVRDGSGNESTTTVTVTVEDNIAPVVSTRDINVTLNTDGTASITASQIDNASIDNCAIAGIGLDKTSFTCEDVGSSLVNLTVTDVNGNSATASATVTVTDATLPIVPIKNVTISLDESGAASIDVADIDNGSSDNCGISTVELSQTGFDCTDLGTNAVTLTVTDVNGNQKTATASVTVLDNNVPTARAQDATISLDQNGFASITAADIDNGSTDNCTISSRVVSVTNFTCVNLGANLVTLTVTDASGNQSMATASVTVTDNIAPIAKAKAINISLDANGVANFTAEDIDNGSSDNCGVASLSADISSFTCAEIGSNTVMLTTTDESGNSTTVETTVIVNDNTSPTVATQDITVSLDATGIVSITPADVDAGSADNCGIADMSLSKTTFTCGNIGTNVVTLTVTDLNGFSSSAPAVVTVVDDLAPVAIAKDLTVYLDQTGMAYIGTNEINDGSNDNCSMGAMSLDVASFSCDNIGENAVVLKVTDLAGNQSTATATVTVVDDKAPMAVAKNLTVSLDENGMANFDADQIDNGSSDNCAVSDTSIDISSFTCAHLGANDVTLTVTDVNGNTSTASATVTVVDNVPPIAVSQNISIELSPEGAGSITVAQIENGSSDNCAIANISLSQSDFDCSHIGENEIQLIIEDDAGNISMSTAIVTVFSLANPQVTTQNITVSLDETGTATITPEQVDNGSVSGCGDPVLSLDKTTFDCTNLGENTVLLTVANTSGTSVSGEAIITVVDNTDPIFTTANKSFDLDENGNVTITSADLVAESEECLTFSLSSYEFSCDNEGQNEVVVTATDAGGNTSEQTATVTILSGEGGTDFEIITSTATQCEGDDVNLMPVVNTMGSALVFSSTSVSTPTTQELNLSSNSAFTIELWFKPASTSRASLISKMSDGGRGYELFFEDGEIGYNLTHNTSGSAVSGKTTNAALSMGEWHHLAFGFDGFQSPSVIIDGTIQNHNIEVNNLTDSLSNSSPLYIGSLGGTQQQFVGAIDEVRIWTEERNLVEIQRLKDVRLDSSFSNLILLYDFENVAAGIVRDKSGYNHHGTVGENALFENRPEKAIDTAKYTFNLLTNIGNENSRAGVLSGSRNPIIARTSAGLSGASSGTIEMWVQWHGTTQDSGYRGAYGVVSSRQYSTRYTSSIIALDNEDPNKAHLIWRPFDQYRNRIVSNRVLDNEWHHVAVTFANNEHRMYIDGELVGSATVTGSMFNIPSSQLIIGGWKFPETVTRTRRYNYRTRRWEVRTQKRIYHEYESFANAGIDEVRVWSRALTQDEIKANKDDFDAKQNGDGLSLYYDFESDFTSGRVLDRSRYRNTGTGVLALGDRPVQFVNPTFLKSGVVVSSKTAMTHVIETTNKISGCSSRDTVYIDIGYPSTPVIASRDNLIVCDEEVGNIRLYMSGISGDPAQSYQWYKDGYRIPNATQANYTASTEGDYRLEVTNSSGCPGISNSITVRSYAISGRILGEATRNSCGKTATIEVEHKNGELFRLQYYYVRYRSWRWYGNWSTATSFEVNPGYRWRVAIASKSCQSRYTDYVYINATHAYESRIANINGSALSTESVDGATQYVTFTGTWVKSYYNHSTSDVDYSWLKDGAEISSDSKIQLNETGIYELIIRNKDGSCEFTGTKLRALAGPSVSLALDTSSGSSCSAGNLQATVDANGIDPSDLKFYWSASYDYVWATTETSFKPYGGYAYQFVVEYKGVRAFSNAVSVPKTEPNISIKAKAAYRCGSRRRPGLVYDANASTNAGNLTYRFYKAYSYFDYRLYKYRVGYKLVETNTTGKYSTYGYGTYSVLASDECNQYVRGSSRLYLNYCGRIYETDDTDVIAADTVVFSADLNLVDLDSLGNETPILVDIGAPMEAPQTDYQFDVSLSPQPAATFTTVKISTMIDHDIEQLEISLYDISGQLMQTKTLNDVRAGLSETYLDVSNLAEGVYLYTINSKGHELDAGRLAILKR